MAYNDNVAGLWSALQFVRDVGRNILPSWRDIAARRRQHPFTEDQRQWQLLRRGRHDCVETHSSMNIAQVPHCTAGLHARESFLPFDSSAPPTLT